jgi:ABC-2 type transport system permease protein
MWVGLAIARQAFLTSLSYRAEIFTQLVVRIIGFSVILYVWRAIYRFPDGTLDIAALHTVTYFFLLAFLINYFTASEFESWRCRQIRDGGIDLFFTRPISYPLQIFWARLGVDALRWICTAPFLALFWWVSTSGLGENTVHLTWSSCLSFLACLLFAYFIEFFTGLIVVFLTFWFEGAEGLQHFKWLTLTLITGFIAPAALLPPWLQQLTARLPFQYMYAIPIQSVLSGQPISLTGLTVMGATLLAFGTGLFGLWHWAQLRYTSAGG